MARILDSVKSVAGKMMANPYDRPSEDSVKMSSTGEVRAYVPPVQQRVKKPARQAAEQQPVAASREMNAAAPQQAEPKQGLFGNVFKRSQQPVQEPQPYTGSQPPVGAPSQPFTGRQQPAASWQQPVSVPGMSGVQQPVPGMTGSQPVSDQQPFNTVLSGKKAINGVKAFFGRHFGGGKSSAETDPRPVTGQQPSMNTGYTTQRPMQQNPTGQQPPMGNTGYTAQRPMQQNPTGQQPPMGNTGYTAQRPMQQNPTGQQPPMGNTGYTAQRPMQQNPTGQQPVNGYTGQQSGQYFSGQHPVNQGAPRPSMGYFHNGQPDAQPVQNNGQPQGGQQANQMGWQHRQPEQQARPQTMPDNVSYMNAENFRNNDGKSYAMVMRVAQPVGVSTCYRVIEFIRRGEAVLVNTELITDPVELTRSLDLLFGAAFAMHACYTRVAQRSLYLITPGSVLVTLYPSLNELHQRDNARRWPGSEVDNHLYDEQPQQEQSYNRERHRRSSRAY